MSDVTDFGCRARLGKVWSYCWLLAEALIVIIVVEVTIKIIPFRRYGRWLQSINGQNNAPQLFSNRLSKVIEIACRILPWTPVCLPRAIAAKTMLAIRGYASVLTLGVADQRAAMTAHAWLTANEVIVCGRYGKQDFHKVADFGK